VGVFICVRISIVTDISITICVLICSVMSSLSGYFYTCVGRLKSAGFSLSKTLMKSRDDNLVSLMT